MSEPAFPFHDLKHTPSHSPHAYVAGGLTKREYFAGMALIGYCANNPNEGRMLCDYENISTLAVQQADRLIVELKKTEIK